MLPTNRKPVPLSKYRRAARLTRELTMFASFKELLTAPAPSPGGYRPVLYTSPHPVRSRRRYTPEQQLELQQRLQRGRELADLYDLVQLQRGDARRAVRL